MEKQVFKANGKFLITSEYLVLKGAKALAVPLKFGQKMVVEEAESHSITWTSVDLNAVWFKAEISLINFKIMSCTDRNIADKLVLILNECKILNPLFCQTKKGFSIVSTMDFDRFWGLGSSSTLITNIAEWANVNPYILLSKTFGGSGYDIACAKATQPIVFQMNNESHSFISVPFNPSFQHQLFFVYLGQKQSSLNEITRFNKHYNVNNEDILEANDLTDSFLKADNMTTFLSLIDEHESLISKITANPKVKDTLFPDFKGGMKSLGAWGGDFALVASPLSQKEVFSYFFNKGYNTIFEFEKMILY